MKLWSIREWWCAILSMPGGESWRGCPICVSYHEWVRLVIDRAATQFQPHDHGCRSTQIPKMTRSFQRLMHLPQQCFQLWTGANDRVGPKLGFPDKLIRVGIKCWSFQDIMICIEKRQIGPDQRCGGWKVYQSTVWEQYGRLLWIQGMKWSWSIFNHLQLSEDLGF